MTDFEGLEVKEQRVGKKYLLCTHSLQKPTSTCKYKTKEPMNTASKYLRCLPLLAGGSGSIQHSRDRRDGLSSVSFERIPALTNKHYCATESPLFIEAWRPTGLEEGVDSPNRYS